MAVHEELVQDAFQSTYRADLDPHQEAVLARDPVALDDLRRTPGQLSSWSPRSPLHHDSGDYSLSAALHLEVSGIDEQTAIELGEGAHQICAYSRATRGNIPVTIDATVA
jgi:hypothetical protein